MTIPYLTFKNEKGEPLMRGDVYLEKKARKAGFAGSSHKAEAHEHLSTERERMVNIVL